MSTAKEKYTLPFAEYPNELVVKVSEEVAGEWPEDGFDTVFMRRLGFKDAKSGILFFSRFSPKGIDGFPDYIVGLETGIRLAEAVWKHDHEGINLMVSEGGLPQ